MDILDKWAAKLAIVIGKGAVDWNSKKDEVSF